jgi:CDP-glucose 4,6-dehydratase
MAGTVRSDFGGAFRGLRVVVTGHTGFKGGWLSLWLNALGAKVTGIALAPESGPSFFDACGINLITDSRFADITKPAELDAAFAGLDAEVVFHLAAQSLVRRSYVRPVETFLTNVIGTAHVLEAARKMPSLKAVVVVTSDKSYDNKGWIWGYRESDPMGGDDPYSASKGCAELLTASYRRSFFAAKDGPNVASARAGNVFGGGDWSEDRLIPDIVNAILAGSAPLIRNPASIRPWQHVLEPLSGYLALAHRMMTDGAAFAEAWNFGPDLDETVDVGSLVDLFAKAWPAPTRPPIINRPENAPHEAAVLRLDSTKAATRLGWRPQLDLEDAVGLTVEWYRAFAQGADMARHSLRQIETFGARMDGDRASGRTT